MWHHVSFKRWIKSGFVLRTSKGASSDEIYMVKYRWNRTQKELQRITMMTVSPDLAQTATFYTFQKVASCDDDIYQIPAAALAPKSKS